jgi:glycosyltransferase involved in cell wall biosynthesis
MKNIINLWQLNLNMSQRIIWLCSWYPNREDAYRGDFIQRQAIAFSEIADIEVFHVVFGVSEREEVIQRNAHLTEHIYYRKFGNRLKRWWDWQRAANHFIKNFRTQYGNPQAVHVHIPLEAGLIAWFWKKRWNWPYLLSEHYGIYNSRVIDHLGNRSWIYRQLLKKVLEAAQKIITVSQSLGKEMMNHFSGLQYQVIPNVVDTALFYPVQLETKNIFQFIHVSGFDENKNILGILQAIVLLRKKTEHFHISLIGGDGSPWIPFIREHQLQNLISFYPAMPYHQVAQFVRNSDAGILFSQSETQSCVVLEWLCAGLPVISSRVGGVVELIHAENGILVEPNDDVALSEAMFSLMTNPSAYDRQKISQQASALYSYKAVAERLRKIYGH